MFSRIKNAIFFMRFAFILALSVLPLLIHAEDYGISGNPGAVSVVTGTAELGQKVFQIPKDSGVRVGGLWITDYNILLHGGNGRGSYNNLVILDLFIDLKKAISWKGASFGMEFLQFNGQPTNTDAGIVQGYNSLPGSPPLNRSELYQLWIRQELWDSKFVIRVGKTIPSYHFNNVSKPVPTENAAISIPSVTGLIYTPTFVNSSLLGVLGGYYNSVYGVTMTIAPIKETYVNLALYDGSLAKGVQTGLTGPRFNGYYFSIGEIGYGWAHKKPGIVAIGGWYQSGLLKSKTESENGTGGLYAFGSKALWIKQSDTTSKGNLSGFFQFGWNNSVTLPMNLFIGGGLTAFAMIPERPNDSFGIGAAWSRLNKYTFSRHSELLLQAYYQAKLYKTMYLQPVISYIPKPGAEPNKSNVWALTGRFTFLF